MAPAMQGGQDDSSQTGPQHRISQIYYEENGRLYGCYRRGKYMFPIDEPEKDRLDIFHRFFLLIRGNRLFRAPLQNPESPRIMDLGCGTGIWAIDVGESHPNAQIVGLDLNLIQPEYIPPNIRFQQLDMEVAWPNMEPGTWDLVYMRTLAGSIANWPRLYSEIFRHLKPRHGCIEQVEINWLPRCDDRTMPPNFSVKRWADDVMDAMDGFDRPLRIDSEATKQRLADAGFVDIVEEVIPFPLNAWPNDLTQKELGRWFYLGFSQGVEGLTLAPLFRGRDMSPADIRAFAQQVRIDARSISVHAYMTAHIFTARKP